MQQLVCAGPELVHSATTGAGPELVVLAAVFSCPLHHDPRPLELANAAGTLAWQARVPQHSCETVRFISPILACVDCVAVWLSRFIRSPPGMP